APLPSPLRVPVPCSSHPPPPAAAASSPSRPPPPAAARHGLRRRPRVTRRRGSAPRRRGGRGRWRPAAARPGGATASCLATRDRTLSRGRFRPASSSPYARCWLPGFIQLHPISCSFLVFFCLDSSYLIGLLCCCRSCTPVTPGCLPLPKWTTPSWLRGLIPWPIYSIWITKSEPEILSCYSSHF
ncbi:UPF0061 protein azo1574, partial [Zea mays]